MPPPDLTTLHRRRLLQLTAAVATLNVLPPLRAATGDTAAQRPLPDDAAQLPLDEAQRIWARLNGDLSGRTVYFTTLGDVWGFKPQADDLALDDFAKRAYGYAGVAARKMLRRADGAIVVRQKSWAFYRDPVSGLLADKITNRWTGAVDTAPPLSGPASERVLLPHAAAADAPDPYGMQVRTLGAHAFVVTTALARFKPRDAGWFKLEGHLASHHCAAADLADAALTHVPSTYTQNLVAEWQTWTHMHGQPGHILFKGDGVPLCAAQAVPDELRRAIEAFFPGQWADVAAWA